VSGLGLGSQNGLCLGRVYGHTRDTAARHRHRHTRHASQTQLDTSLDTLYKLPIQLLTKVLQMSEVKAIEWSINVQKLKQTRTYVLCVCNLPDEVRDRLSANDVVKAHGSFLLGFSTFPVVDESFPYAGQIWKVKSIVQFPHRYKTTQTKYPAIAQLEWVGSYESIESVLAEYLNLSSED